jgi:hypothetical protein
VGKRPEDRLGHANKANPQAIKITVATDVHCPVKVDPLWHPIAKDWFRSLAKSGQATLYEPSDWQTARYVAEAMSRNLAIGRFSAVLFASVLSGMSSLLVTEGDRRRLNIELHRAGATDADTEAADATVVSLQSRFGTGA